MKAKERIFLPSFFSYNHLNQLYPTIKPQFIGYFTVCRKFGRFGEKYLVKIHR